MSTARNLRMLDHAAKNLIEAAFHEGPVFRMGFDAHVRKWKAHVGRTVFVKYHTEREFQEAYDSRRLIVAMNTAKALAA